MFLAYLVICLVGGTAFMAITLGMQAGFTPFMFAGLRFFSAGLILLMYLRLFRRWQALDINHYTAVLRIGLFTTTLRFAALYWAQQFIPSGQAALLAATYPLMIILVHSFDRRHLPPNHQWIGLVGGFSGVMLLLQAPLQAPLSAIEWAGSLAVLGGELFNAVGTITARRILSKGIPVLQMNALQMLLGSLGLLAFGVFGEGLPSLAVWSAGLWPFLWLTLFGSVLGTTLFYWLVKKMGPVIPSTWSYAAPVIALLAGFLFLGEIFTSGQLMGAALIIIFVFAAHSGPEILSLLLKRRRAAS